MRMRGRAMSARPMASRYRPTWSVLGGIFIATLANHALASLGRASGWRADCPRPCWAGSSASASSPSGSGRSSPIAWKNVSPRGSGAHSLTTTVVFFLAEMGDKTQLATVALGARYHSTVAVTAGTTAGMMLADRLAVFAGTTLTRVRPMARLRRSRPCSSSPSGSPRSRRRSGSSEGAARDEQQSSPASSPYISVTCA